jgi:glycosyltransferase involved in cell wall biosynthesis
MKVLHIIPSVASVRGGPSQSVLEMVSALRSQGIDAEIVTTNDNSKNLLDVPLHQLTDQFAEYENVPIRFFPRFSPNIHAVREFSFSRSLTTWLWRHISEYDLVHVHTIFSYAPTIAMAIARIKKIPYINTPCGMLCEWSLEQKSLKKEIYLRLFEKANLQASQFLHLSSTQEQQELELLGWDLSNLILPYGLALPAAIANAREQLHQMLNLPTEIPVILFLSRLHLKKGLDYLIPALGKLRDCAGHHNFAFVLAGSGSAEYEAEVERLLQENHLADRTYKLGFVAGEKKNICLQGADLYALTSHSENFGIAVLEALASGTPALLTTGVGLSDLVKKQNLGWVVDLEIEAIATAIQDFLDHPQIANQIGDRAAQYVSENYTWSEIANRLIVIYKNILRIKA